MTLNQVFETSDSFIDISDQIFHYLILSWHTNSQAIRRDNHLVGYNMGLIQVKVIYL